MSWFFILGAFAIGVFLLSRIPNITTVDSFEESVRNIAQEVSVIIPARNEARTLPDLLHSLDNQDVRLKETIVIDDDSIDGTGRLAREAGVKVVTPPPLPNGWTGKSWACWNGAQNAEGKYFLFFDADVTLSKDAARSLIVRYLQNKGVISVQPYHTMKRPYERFSLYFNLIAMMSMRSFSPLGERIRPLGLFGPCILCSKEDYLRIDGHRSIRDSILDDVALGKRFREKEVGIHLFGGARSVRFRMYPNGMKSLVEGWSKNFASGAQSADLLTLFTIIVWVTGGIHAMAGLIRGFSAGDPVGFLLPLGVYILYALQIYWMAARIGNFGLWTALAFPVYISFFVLIFFRSLYLKFLKKSVRWKERDIRV